MPLDPPSRHAQFCSQYHPAIILFSPPHPKILYETLALMIPRFSTVFVLVQAQQYMQHAVFHFASVHVCYFGCNMHRKYSLCTLVCRFCVSRKDGTGGGEWIHLQDAVYMAGARLGYKRAMVGTGWANSCLGWAQKCYSQPVGDSFLARKVVWAFNGSLLAENADYCKFDSEWAWLGSRVCCKSTWVQFSLTSHTLHREEGSGHTATIELSPWQKLAATNEIRTLCKLHHGVQFCHNVFSGCQHIII